MSIHKFLQKAIWGLLLFARMTLKKSRDRAGDDFSFSNSSVQKSSFPKYRFLRELGYRRALAFVMLFFVGSLHYAATLQSLVVTEAPGKTSIVCTFDRVPSYKSFLLSAPTRAVVDLEQTHSPMHLNQLPVVRGVIGRLRSGSPSRQSLRLVFDLKQPSDMHIVHWKTGMNGAQGIRIDLIPRAQGVASSPIVSKATKRAEPAFTPHVYQPSPSAPAVTAALSKPVSRPQSNINEQPILARHAPSSGHRDVVIVIDAGHGGKDPGAMGPRRNVEKNVTLAIARKLKEHIDRQPGMRAVMTRNGDYYVGLRERLNITRKYNADMFVSIHADAFNNRNSNGASVYALSPTGATSEAARWLAEKENYSELGGVDLSGLDDRNGLIRTVLLDLSQTATINAGLQVGDRILRHLDQMTTLHHNKVEQARFVVLKSPDIPSILVETGFISNPREEFNLTSPSYQTRLSQAIFNGIKRYFWDSPPHGSRIEAMQGGANLLAKSEIPTRRTDGKWQIFGRRGKPG